MIISSDSNPRIKSLRKLLEKSRERKKTNSFVVEGIQENKFALRANFELLESYVCPDIYKGEIDNYITIPKLNISKAVYAKLAYRETTEGIICVYKESVESKLPLKVNKQATYIILEAIEKPGNLGAILRSCDALSCDGIILIDVLVDIYNPNVIRSSVGTIFSNNIYKSTFNTTIEWLKNQNIHLYTTHLHLSSKSLSGISFRDKSAILFGTENSGVSNQWVEKSDDIIKIPMHGMVESLNVSNSVAICLFESLRQKKG